MLDRGSGVVVVDGEGPLGAEIGNGFAHRNVSALGQVDTRAGGVERG